MHQFTNIKYGIGYIQINKESWVNTLGRIGLGLFVRERPNLLYVPITLDFMDGTIVETDQRCSPIVAKYEEIVYPNGFVYSNCINIRKPGKNIITIKPLIIPNNKNRNGLFNTEVIVNHPKYKELAVENIYHFHCFSCENDVCFAFSQVDSKTFLFGFDPNIFTIGDVKYLCDFITRNEYL
jgi:hypothetical protein